MGRETHAVEILTKEFTQGRAEEETKIIYQKKKKKMEKMTQCSKIPVIKRTECFYS